MTDQMMMQRMADQMADKGGFIAALDQSGGSTPGALKLYGIPEDSLFGRRRDVRADARDARPHHDRARLHRRQGDRRDPVRGDDGRRSRGRAGSDLSVEGARHRALPQDGQGARGGGRRRQPDEADPRARRPARACGEARRVRHQDALGDQPAVADRHRRDREAAVRDRRADLGARAGPDPRARGADQEPRQGRRRGDPACRADQGVSMRCPRASR